MFSYLHATVIILTSKYLVKVPFSYLRSTDIVSRGGGFAAAADAAAYTSPPLLLPQLGTAQGCQLPAL